MDLARETKQSLASRCDELQQTLDDLRRSMSGAGSLPSEWGLTPKETSLFLTLIRSAIVTKPMAQVVLYQTTKRPAHSVDVFMSRIRQKTKNFGVQIETINRTGYRLVDRQVWAKTLKLDTVEHH